MKETQKEVFKVLNDRGTEAIVVGDRALQNYGYPHGKDRLDIWVNTDNGKRLKAIVDELAPGNKISEAQLSKTNSLQITKDVHIHIADKFNGLPFKEAFDSRKKESIEGQAIGFINPQDLKNLYEKAGKDKARERDYLDKFIQQEVKPIKEMAKPGKIEHRDFDQFVKNIDLVTYAKQVHGYQEDTSKTSKKWTTLKNEAETIIVARNEKGVDIYYNPNVSQDKGTVVDFEKKRSGDWKTTFERMDNYLGTNPTREQQRPFVEEPKRATAVAQGLELKEFTNTAYLESRGLTKDTLSSEQFKGAIFNSEFTKDGKTHINTAFPLKNEENAVVSSIVRNEGMQPYVVGGSRGNAVWLAEPKDQPAKTLVITESPIDALSYHQLKPEQANDKRAYLSTGGGLASDSAATISAAVIKHHPDKIILANDNDKGGIKNNVNIAGQITHLNAEDSFKVWGKVDINSTNVVLNVRIHANDEVEAIQKLNMITELTRSHTEKGEVLVQKGGYIEAAIHMPRTLGALKKAEIAVIESKGLSNIVKIERPLNKDFNEDLQKGVQYIDKKQYKKVQSQTEEGFVNRMSDALNDNKKVQELVDRVKFILKPSENGVTFDTERKKEHNAMSLTSKDTTTFTLKGANPEALERIAQQTMKKIEKHGGQATMHREGKDIKISMEINRMEVFLRNYDKIHKVTQSIEKTGAMKLARP